MGALVLKAARRAKVPAHICSLFILNFLPLVDYIMLT